MIKIGIDLHDTADALPDFFIEFTKALVHFGNEVHIITGITEHKALTKINSLQLNFTHIFSITDYLTSKGHSVTYDKNKNPQYDPNVWDRAKSEYCKEKGIHLHIDDSDEYGKYFTTPYAQFRRNS